MNCHQTKAARNRHLLVGGQIKIYLCLAIERYVWLACYTVGSNTILKPCKSPKSTTNPYIRMIPALRQGIMADIKLQAQLSLPAESPSCCHTTLPQLSVCACLIWLNKPPYITVHVNKAVPFHWDHQPPFSDWQSSQHTLNPLYGNGTLKYLMFKSLPSCCTTSSHENTMYSREVYT